MAATAVTSLNGLAFSISPAKKQPKKRTADEDDEEHILTLAPFTKPPKISLGTVPVDRLVQRHVLIVNPQQFPLDVLISNQELNINNVPVTIAAQQSVNLCIKWQPEQPGNHKYSIVVECTNTARLKFIIHAYGVCAKPAAALKKPVRRPLVALQPLKREKTSASSLQPVTNESLAAAAKPAGPTVTRKVMDETIVVKQEVSVSSRGREDATRAAPRLAKSATMHGTANWLYSDEADKTPKLESFLAPGIQRADVSVTPKLSDFVRAPDESAATAGHTQTTTAYENSVTSTGRMCADEVSGHAEDFLRTPNLNAITFKRKVIQSVW
jgi:hypothetical protein